MYPSTVAKDIWWALVLRGIATVIFGIAAVFWPGITLVTVVYLFSAYVLISGIINIIVGIREIERLSWWFLTILLGIFELGVGVYLLRHPLVSFVTLILLIGFTLIARGVIEVVESFFESGVTVTGRTLSVIVGLAAILTGIVLLFQPASAGVAFVWILGIYALVVGSLHLAMAIDARRTLNELELRTRR